MKQVPKVNSYGPIYDAQILERLLDDPETEHQCRLLYEGKVTNRQFNDFVENASSAIYCDLREEERREYREREGEVA